MTARLVLNRIESQTVTGWARWHVTDAGVLVGIVVEDHDWLGTTHGPASYTVAHNPTAAPWAALWRSEGHATPKAAMTALGKHLDDIRPQLPPGDDRRQP